MKKRIATPPQELISKLEPPTPRHEGNGPEAAGCDDQEPFRRIQRRTITFVLTVSVVMGGLLLLSGFNAQAKGLLLGSLFSVLNFFLMAVFLPMRMGYGRSKSSLISLASLYLRFALLAIPLIVAAKYAQFALTATSLGLFMVQIVLIIDQLWLQQHLSARS